MPLPTTAVPPVPAPRAPVPPTAGTAQGPTTYSRLTRSAATQLAHALVTLDVGGQGESDPARALLLHRHLTATLGHLGTTLRQPLEAAADDRHARPRRRRGDDALAARLTAAGMLRDWTTPPPRAGSAAADLLAAARLVGAAADLWATHHDASGAPRSPEASRLRHPATLGAATREWRELVVLAGAVADVLARSVVDGEVGAQLRQYAAAYPQPGLSTRPARGPVTITVARPPRTRPSEPLAGIEECVRALRLVAWRLAGTGMAPIPILVNLAVAGVILNRATAVVAQRAASGAAVDPTCAEAATTARATALAWRRAAAAIAPLRSAHPATTSVQVERLDLQRLLDQVTAGRPRPDRAAEAEALIRLSRAYDEVAGQLADALVAAQSRGEILLDGRALPHEALVRRPDLLEAKLRGWAVPSPTAPITRAEAALRAVSDPTLRDVTPGGPAA